MGKFDISTVAIKCFFLKDEQAVKEIYNKTYRLLYHIAFSFLKRREDAEDIVSETYLKALNCDGSKIIKPHKFISFISSICRNSCLDLLKKQEKETLLDNVEVLSSHDCNSTLLDAFKNILTDDQYNVFMYKAYFGLSYKEISPLIGKNEGRCRVIYSEAKKKIKENKEMFL